MKTLGFKNWRALLFLFLILVFFVGFFYFFIVEKNIIQFLPPKQSRSSNQSPPTIKKIKANPTISSYQKLSWKTLKEVFQTFLNNLKLRNIALMKLSYIYKQRNLYQLKPFLNRQNFEKMVIFEISKKIAFYDLKVIFEYNNDLITVKITITVDKKPNQIVSQTYWLKSI